MTTDPRAKGMLEIDKKHFLEGLREAPSRAYNDNPKLRELCSTYREKLNGCYDEIGYDLEKFSIYTSMTYDAFIYMVLSGQ